MRVYLSKADVGFILESLRYTKMAFEDYTYPDVPGVMSSYEYKLERLADVDTVADKLRKAKKGAKR